MDLFIGFLQCFKKNAILEHIYSQHIHKDKIMKNKVILSTLILLNFVIHSVEAGSVTLTEKPGWPIAVTKFTQGVPILHDLNHDEVPEIIMVEKTGFVQAFDINTNLLWSVPALGNPSFIAAASYHTPSGPKSIVAFSNITSSGVEFYLVDENGQTLPGWPITFLTTPGFTLNSSTFPMISDLDKDDIPEVIFGLNRFSFNGGNESEIFVYSLDGHQMNTHPIIVKDIFAFTSIAKIKEQKKIVASTTQKIYAWDPKGNLLDGFPIQPIPGSSGLTRSAIASMNNEDFIVQPVVRNKTITDHSGRPQLLATQIFLFNLKGEPVNEPIPLIVSDVPAVSGEGLQLLSAPAIGDVNGDKIPDIVIGTLFYFEKQDPQQYHWPISVFAFSLDGKPLSGFEGGVLIEDNIGPASFASSPVIADIDGQPGPEILMSAEVVALEGLTPGGYLFGIDKDGHHILTQSVDADIDAPSVSKDENGETIIAMIGNNPSSGALVFSFIHLWTTSTLFQPHDAHWRTYKRDAQHTNNFQIP